MFRWHSICLESDKWMTKRVDIWIFATLSYCMANLLSPFEINNFSSWPVCQFLLFLSGTVDAKINVLAEAPEMEKGLIQRVAWTAKLGYFSSHYTIRLLFADNVIYFAQTLGTDMVVFFTWSANTSVLRTTAVDETRGLDLLFKTILLDVIYEVCFTVHAIGTALLRFSFHSTSSDFSLLDEEFYSMVTSF